MAEKFKYRDYEKHVVIGEGIDDFYPYYITLPDPPSDVTKIKNYGLPPEKQFYVRDELPDKIVKLNRLDVREAWEIAKKDKSVMDFIKTQWDKRINGEFCYINGQLYYITPDHWFFLNNYPLEDGYPLWRWVDSEYFYLWEFEVLRSDVCYGMIEMTIRRDGKSYRAGSIMLNKITKTQNANGGIQSKTNQDSTDMFQRCIVMQWRQLPFYFSPVYDNTSFPRKELNFRMPSKKGADNNIGKLKDIEELNSWIEARSTVEIAFDGTKLSDYIGDEFGKTVDMKVDDTWRVVKQCLRVRDRIVGRARITSTIEELTRKGGQQFKNIWDNSSRNPKDRKINDLGQTVSGLIPYFKPAYSTYRFDQYGFSVIDKPLPYQEQYFRKMKFKYPDKGGKELIELERSEIRNAQDRQAHIRMYPNTIREAFRPDHRECHFNSELIDKRLEYFYDGKEKGLVRGSFRWVNQVGGDVYWQPNPEGWWLNAYILEPDKANAKSMVGGRSSPANFDKFVIGCDPFKYNVTTSNKPSMGSGYVWMYYDEAVDRDKEESDFISDDFICEFYGRPSTVDLFSEEMLKAAIYYGCKVNPENNAGSVWSTFERLNCGQYLHFPKKLKKEGAQTVLVTSKTPGSTTLGSAIKDSQFRAMEWYIDTKAHRCKFYNLLEDARYVEYDNVSPYDCFMGAVQTLMPVRELKQRPKVEPKSFTSFVRKRTY